MSQTLLTASAADTLIRTARVGEDVWVHLKSVMAEYSREYLEITGMEAPLIQQMDFNHCCEVFPHMTDGSQSYAMAAISATYMTACVRLIPGFEHLYLKCPIEQSKFHEREFIPDSKMFTIGNPLALKRLFRMDAQFAQYVSDHHPIHNGNIHHFIEQVRMAPDELSKSNLCGMIATTAIVRIKPRCKNFDRWFMGQYYHA